MSEPEPLQQLGRTYVRFRGRKLSYFSGCDYFRLASHPKVLAAMADGAKLYGLNVAASRLTTGNHPLYQKLERQLAGFFRAENALLVSTGYLANLIVAQALAGQFSHALLDEASHPSLSDAARLLDCPVLRFAHRQPGDLAAGIGRCGPGSRLILLTDGMFSRDGSAAPLKQYLQILPADALMLVDDAHAAGVLGPSGRGSLEHAGVARRRVIQTITLSKAFGTYGGAILATAALRRKIINHSQIFVGSTPLPLPLANAALKALKIRQAEQSLPQRLARNADYVKRGWRAAGLPLPDAPGPILALVPKDARAASKIYRRLLQARIYPPFIHYPGGPARGYFRFVVSSEHTRGQLNLLLETVTATANPRA